MGIRANFVRRTAVATVLLVGIGHLTQTAAQRSTGPSTDVATGRVGGRRHRRQTTTTTQPPAVTTPSTAPATTAPASTLPATTAPATTTATTKPPTTVAATTVATVPPTTGPATTPATTTPGNRAGCVLSKATQPATVTFCETFDAATPNPATRSGDLNSVLWGVSRVNTHANLGQGENNIFYPATLLGCGAPQTVLPPNDVRICNGRVVEAFADNHGQATIAMYPKQPFDISGGRTGTISFDVSADSQSNHAAWPEFWWTDKPVPAPHGHLSSNDPYARHSFGFSMAGQCAGNKTTVDNVMVTRTYAEENLPFTIVDCVTKGSATGALNHVEVRINTNRVEIYAADAGSSAVKLIAYADNLNLTLTKGLIWLEHVSYNGCKFDTQCDHTFAWDNVAFDGPVTYRDLSFDVPDANEARGDGGRALGYRIGATPRSFTVNGVYRNQAPTGALVTFNWWAEGTPAVPSFRINGGAWHDSAWPFATTETYTWRTIDVAVPVAELHDGANTIEFKSAPDMLVSNINAILVAGAPVP